MIFCNIMIIDECQSEDMILEQMEFESREVLDAWLDDYKHELESRDSTPFTILVEGFLR